MATADIAIGTEHGPGCTCRKLDPVEITYTPVIINRDCPGQNEIPRTDDIAGTVTITWPAKHHAPIMSCLTEIRDADTGVLLAGVTELTVYGNATDREVIAEIRQYVDRDGKRTEGAACHIGDDGDVLSGVFRYVVEEMRVAGA